MKVFTLIIAIFTLTISAEENNKGAHLFILSGQSNMAGLKSDNHFTPIVKKAFGEENAIVVRKAWSGRPIRVWYNVGINRKTKKPNGPMHLYKKMMDAVKEATKDRKIATVTFIWMQGETDAHEKKGESYEANLKGLLAEVKKDMGIEKLNFVIGRLSDCDMENKKYAHWTMIRDIQVKVAESDPSGAWVDTDDLNTKKNKQGEEYQGLHYSSQGYKILGQRFAEKAIQLIKKQ